jgi:hypothetical protein
MSSRFSTAPLADGACIDVMPSLIGSTFLTGSSAGAFAIAHTIGPGSPPRSTSHEAQPHRPSHHGTDQPRRTRVAQRAVNRTRLPPVEGDRRRPERVQCFEPARAEARSRDGISSSRRRQMAANRGTGGSTGGIGLGGILVIVGIVLMIVWSFWVGLIVTLVGLIAFGGFAKGKWY